MCKTGSYADVKNIMAVANITKSKKKLPQLSRLYKSTNVLNFLEEVII